MHGCNARDTKSRLSVFRSTSWRWAARAFYDDVAVAMTLHKSVLEPLPVRRRSGHVGVSFGSAWPHAAFHTQNACDHGKSNWAKQKPSTGMQWRRDGLHFTRPRAVSAEHATPRWSARLSPGRCSA